MPEQDKKPGEGAQTNAIDTTKLVPKEDFEKLSKESKEQVTTLQSELETAKLSLLDPEYIAFRESKKSKALAKEAKSISDELKDSNVTGNRVVELEDRINRLSTAVEDLLALQELAVCEKKYSDFNDYRDSVRKTLEDSTTPLTIEQAYLLVKGSTTKTDKTDAEKAAGAKAGSEKPGSGVNAGSTQPTSFKDKKSAADAAWDEVVGAGKDTL